MALNDFIQADKITGLATALVKKITVFGSVAKVSNEKASSVQVPVYNGGTLRDYTAGAKMVVDYTAGAKTKIAVDQSKYMNNLIDKVDTKTSAQKVLPQVLNDMANQPAVAIETHAFARFHTLATGVHTTLGTTGAPITVDDEASTKKLFKDARVALKKNDITLGESFAVLSPEIEALAVELKAFSPAVDSNDKALSNGYLGKVYGIDVYSSNNLPIPANDQRGILFGSKRASNVIFNYNEFSNGDAGIEYNGEYVRVVSQYGAGLNNPKLILAGVVVETGTVA